MRIQKEIPELLEQGLISQETADKILAYYKAKTLQSPNRLVLVFGLLGAILVGLGIILLIAHNWDDLSRFVKIVLAFLPLLIAQGLCAYALLGKKENTTWKESCSAGLFFAVGASIALVAQIFHIHGDLAAFLQTWVWLCLPVIYIMASRIASILYITGITYYAVCAGGIFSSDEGGTAYYHYLLMFLSILPYYIFQYRKNPGSNFIAFHHWLVPLSFSIALFIIPGDTKEWLMLTFMSLFGLYLFLGNNINTATKKTGTNGYTFLGAQGTIVLLLFLSFDDFWEGLRRTDLHLLNTPESLASVIITLSALGVFVFKRIKRDHVSQPLEYAFLAFLFIFCIGISSPAAVVLINILVLVLGIWIIWNGAKADHLGIINYGLLVISALVVCRFFDQDLTFVVRGLLFVAVGLGFFLTNFLMVQKRKAHDQK